MKNLSKKEIQFFAPKQMDRILKWVKRNYNLSSNDAYRLYITAIKEGQWEEAFFIMLYCFSQGPGEEFLYRHSSIDHVSYKEGELKAWAIRRAIGFKASSPPGFLRQAGFSCLANNVQYICKHLKVDLKDLVFKKINK